jgi:hypothetical protein
MNAPLKALGWPVKSNISSAVPYACLNCSNVTFSPNADFETRLSIGPLGGVKPTCIGHARIIRVSPEAAIGGLPATMAQTGV